MRRIETEADLAEGAAALAAMDPRLAVALAQVGPLPLRLRPDGFGALVDAIISQQVSVASARAISARCRAAGVMEPGTCAALSEDALRACGLSRQKVRYVQALAGAGIDYDALRALPTDEVVARLVVVPGIGRWTAEIYAMFSLGHADAFAPGDLALQEAARILYDLPARPTEARLRKMAADWSPWRAVAARLLFSYYHHAKQREGLS